MTLLVILEVFLGPVQKSFGQVEESREPYFFVPYLPQVKKVKKVFSTFPDV